MEKFYCEIFGQKIIVNEKQCHLKRYPGQYYNHPTCLGCPEHKKFILARIAPVQSTNIQTGLKTSLGKHLPEVKRTIRRPPKRIKKWHPPRKIKADLIPDESFKKYPDLRQLVEDIPFILNLHPSYWEDQHFLQWQLIRLNKDYQKDFLEVFDLYDEILKTDRIINERLMSELNQLNDDYFPYSPNEPFDLWERGLVGEGDLLEEKKLASTWHDIKVLRACKYGSDPYDEKNAIGFRHKSSKGDVVKMILLSPEFYLQSIPPIPYEVRFPLPYFLKKLPPYEEEWKSKQGSPMVWGRNLLAYELRHEFQIGEDIIACLLFDIKKSSKYEEKHNKIQQIKRTIKRIEKSVLNSYPLPFPT